MYPKRTNDQNILKDVKLIKHTKGAVSSVPGARQCCGLFPKFFMVTWLLQPDLRLITVWMCISLSRLETNLIFVSSWAGKVGGKSFHLYLHTANLIGRREANKLGLCFLFEPVALHIFQAKN